MLDIFNLSLMTDPRSTDKNSYPHKLRPLTARITISSDFPFSMALRVVPRNAKKHRRNKKKMNKGKDLLRIY